MKKILLIIICSMLLTSFAYAQNLDFEGTLQLKPSMVKMAGMRISQGEVAHNVNGFPFKIMYLSEDANGYSLKVINEDGSCEDTVLVLPEEEIYVCGENSYSIILNEDKSTKFAIWVDIKLEKKE